jgi:lysophospholipase L1-like esterase
LAAWTTALTSPSFVFNNPGNYGFENKTLRQHVFLSAGGDALRLRLTNRWGERPLTIGKAAVAYRHTPLRPDLVDSSVTSVLFGGKESVTLQAGEDILSDPVPLEAIPGQVLAIDLYLPDATGPVAYNFLPGTTNYLADGNRSGEVSGGSFAPLISSYIVKDVEVLNSESRGLIAVCCDSVSMTGQLDAHMRWPEILSRLMQDRLGAKAPSVVQTTLSGQRLLTTFKYAESVLDRFQRDVLSLAGLEAVILFVGVNDLGVPQMPDIDTYRPTTDVTAMQMIEGFRQVAAMANEADIPIFVSTITPGSGYVHRGSPYWSPEQEKKRKQINEWIRDNEVFAGVFDFARAVESPFDEEYYSPLNSGDNIHPNDSGQLAIALAVDVDRLLGSLSGSR